MNAPTLEPKMDFAVGVARQDLRDAEQLEIADATRADLLAHLGALTSSLRNTLVALDALMGAGATP